MKILYLCFDTGIDLSGLKGASIHVRSFVHALSALGHEVTVVGTKMSSPESFEAATHATAFGAPLASWNRKLLRAMKAGNQIMGRSHGRGRDVIRVFHNPEFFRVADEFARRHLPSFVYERYSLWGTAGIRLARKWSIPLVLEVNSPLSYEEQHFRDGVAFPALARWAERRIWRRADVLVAVSEAFRSRFEKAGVAPQKVRVLPNAVDTSLFRAEVDDDSLRSRLNLDGRFVVGFVGSFKAWHGVDILFKAFARLRGEDAAYHLLLVGDGPMRTTLEDETRRLGLQEVVTFVGSVPHEDVPRYLAVMDVAVAPYPALEDFYYSPLKLYEYMAAGRAIVASKIGQVGEAVADGLTGLLYEPDDVEGLLHCLHRLRSDKKLKRELGLNARMACSKNTWRQSAERVVGWVEPLLEHKALAYPNHLRYPACERGTRSS
jgi:glycosyltransferase involved in cell wall biosynthesis